ncbi:hypothetical protein F5Y15DRAFT_130298 [Xylariaceae sp. FL0016]|nr:hypothetical protein F5Y15DRAFT_130298 [Xylariaceae sp. FL0016]
MIFFFFFMLVAAPLPCKKVFYLGTPTSICQCLLHTTTPLTKCTNSKTMLPSPTTLQPSSISTMAYENLLCDHQKSTVVFSRYVYSDHRKSSCFDPHFYLAPMHRNTNNYIHPLTSVRLAVFDPFNLLFHFHPPTVSDYCSVSTDCSLSRQTFRHHPRMAAPTCRSRCASTVTFPPSFD